VGSIPTHSTYWRSWIFEDTVKGGKIECSRKIEWSGVVMLFANGIKKGGGECIHYSNFKIKYNDYKQ
jgi:hypothetical protein